MQYVAPSTLPLSSCFCTLLSILTIWRTCHVPPVTWCLCTGRWPHSLTLLTHTLEFISFRNRSLNQLTLQSGWGDHLLACIKTMQYIALYFCLTPPPLHILIVSGNLDSKDLNLLIFVSNTWHTVDAQ